MRGSGVGTEREREGLEVSGGLVGGWLACLGGVQRGVSCGGDGLCGGGDGDRCARWID